MKSSERHRLKENELSHALSGAAATVAGQRRAYTAIVVIVVLILAGAGGFWAWRTRGETRAQTMLADATAIIQAPIVPPAADATGKVVQAPGSYPNVGARAEAGLAKLMLVADAYPATAAGTAARYYAASALAMLGRPADAVMRYQEVVDRAGAATFYGRMSQLGVIDAQVQAKQFDQAIAKAQALANANDEALPRDAMLMELGRAYAAAGKKPEAKQTFDKVLAEFPESPYVEEAKALLTSLT